MRSPFCLSVNPPPINFFEYRNQSLWNLYVRVYNGTWAHFNGVLHESLPSDYVSVRVSFLSLLGNGSVTTFPQQRIQATIEELLDTCVCGSVCANPLSLLGNNSVKKFPRQRRIVGGVVFYAVVDARTVSRWLVLPRTSCSLSSALDRKDEKIRETKIVNVNGHQQTI
jgi:hypothetical protein